MATIAAPLYNLLKSNVNFEWSPACEEAFQKIKKTLTTPPILGTPDVTKGPFTLTCDASLTGLGAVLTQETRWTGCHPSLLVKSTKCSSKKLLCYT